MNYQVELPGAASRDVAIETSLFGIRAVSVGGMPVSRGPGAGHPFLVPLAEGGFGELTFKFGWTRSNVTFQGQPYPLGRKLNLIEAALVLLPFGLGLAFGLAGWLAGAGAALINGLVMRANLPGVLRVAAGIISIGVAGALAFYISVGFAAGVFVTPDWEKVGACWKSLPTGEEVESIPTLDCAQAHVAEVYAVPVVSPDDIGGGYDQARLTGWAEQECLAAFEPFVGLGYQESRLEVYFVFPSLTTWAVGDRLVVCALVDAAGEPLVGSMRGSVQ